MNHVRRSMGALMRSVDHVGDALYTGCTTYEVVNVTTQQLSLNLFWRYAAFAESGYPRWIGTTRRPGMVIIESPWSIHYELC